MTRVSLAVLGMGIGTLMATTAIAQDVVPTDVEERVVEDEEEEKHEGWKNRARVSANVSFNDVRNVVGTIEGSTWQIGAQINGGAHYRMDKHDWENTLSLNVTQTRTPALEQFVKSADELRISTVYLYRIADYLGPFAQAAASTAILPGNDVRAASFVAVSPDGTAEDIEGGENFRLTDPFEPLTISESLGGFAIAAENELITAKFKLGVGGEHVVTFGDDALVLSDDDGTDEIEYSLIESANQIGAVFNANLEGTLREGVTYNFGGKLFYAVESDNDDITGSDRLSVEADAKVSVELVEWASLDYVLIFRRIPWVVDANQITNGLMLSIGYDLI